MQGGRGSNCDLRRRGMQKRKKGKRGHKKRSPNSIYTTGTKRGGFRRKSVVGGSVHEEGRS